MTASERPSFDKKTAILNTATTADIMTSFLFVNSPLGNSLRSPTGVTQVGMRDVIEELGRRADATKLTLEQLASVRFVANVRAGLSREQDPYKEQLVKLAIRCTASSDRLTAGIKPRGITA